MRAMFDQPLVSGLAKAVEEAQSASGFGAGDGGDDDMGITRVAREAYEA
jgi:hypothetical protein